MIDGATYDRPYPELRTVSEAGSMPDFDERQKLSRNQ
jgi:hypothetical protein